MSQENVDLVLESVRRFKPETMDEWEKLWHPDTRMTVPAEWPEQGPFIGLDAVRQQFEGAFEVFPDFDVENVEIVAASGEWVVARFHGSNRGRASGIASDVNFAAAYRVEDGRLAEWAARWRVDEALEAAGLRE
jgi:ketosteroid isomerase-like protein